MNTFTKGKRDKLSDEQKVFINKKYESKKKSKITGGIMALLGLYYPYVGQYGMRCIYILTSIATLGIGGLGRSIVTIMSGMDGIDEYNDDLFYSLVSKYS